MSNEFPPTQNHPLSVQYDSQRHSVKCWMIFLSQVPWKASRRLILSQRSPPIRNVRQCEKHYQYFGLQTLEVDLYKMLNDCASQTGEKRQQSIRQDLSWGEREGKTKKYRQYGLNTKQIFFECISIKLNLYSSVSSQELGLCVFVQINKVLYNYGNE